MSKRDGWLLPNQQREYPSRRVLSEAHLHGRREATFLLLAGTFLVAAAMLPVLGMTRIIDASGVIPDLELPTALLLPVGVLAYPLSFTAANLVCELWGRRRANALVFVGLILNLALLGLLAITDSIPDASGRVGDSLVPGLAFITCYFVGHMFNVQAYHALRRQSRGRHIWLRRNVAALISVVAGWVVFALVLYTHAVQVAEQPSQEAAKQVASVALACGVYTFAFAVVDTLPFAMVARSLTVFLRVGRSYSDSDRYIDGPTAGADSSPRLRAAVVVDTQPPPPPPAKRDPSSKKGFSTAEHRFFTEGEELSTGDVDIDERFDDAAARGGQSA